MEIKSTICFKGAYWSGNMQYDEVCFYDIKGNQLVTLCDGRSLYDELRILNNWTHIDDINLCL